MFAITSQVPRAISFSGCGFIGVYHIGIIKSFLRYGQKLLERLECYGGASAGSLAAAVLAICPHKLTECQKTVNDMISRTRALYFGPITPGFNLSVEMRKIIESVLPEDAHKKANGRLFLSVTHRKCGKNMIISDFISRQDLIECLVCSCHIPLYSGATCPVFRDEQYYDGGITNNLVHFDDKETIYVTPFSGGLKYLCPRDKITRWNFNRANQDFCINKKNMRRLKDALIPPSDKVLDQYCQQGFIQGLIYLVDLDEKYGDFKMTFQSEASRLSVQNIIRDIHTAK